ncbi:MAG: TonB-dependent receptor [Fidelibacterota bacterium]|nr:MAG: TonB-dependent receptor [Candidatus Neomarinimicrobiota bacterium]
MARHTKLVAHTPLRYRFSIMLMCICLVLTYATPVLFAQSNGRISGYLRDADTGEPLKYANVVLQGTARGAASNVHGFYVIIGIPPGNYRLRAMMMGYETGEQDVTVTPGGDLRVDMELNVKAIVGEEVIITADRVRFEEMVETSRINLTMKEIKSTPAFVEADLFRTLQMMPGVQATNDFSSALVVRGGSPDENLVLLDGIEVYNPFHLGGIFSTFNADALANAEFMAGGFPSPYGNRNSSVLEITSKEGNSKKALLFKGRPIANYWNLSQLHGEVSLLSSKFLAEGPIRNGSWMFAWRRTYYDQLVNLYYWYKGGEPIGAYYFRDIHGKAIYNLSATDRLVFATYNGRDFATVELEGDDGGINLDLNWGNNTYSVQWRHVPNSKFISLLSLANTSYDWDFYVGITQVDTSAGETSTNIVQTVGLNDWTVKEKLEWYLNTEHTITAGFEFKTLGMHIRQAIGDLTMFKREQNPYILSLYAQDRWQLGPALSLQPGIRLSSYELHPRLYVEPRIGLKYFLNRDLALKGSWGIYKQFLFTSTSDDQVLNFVDFWLPIPRENHAQSTHHFILGLEQWLGEGFFMSLVAYYKPYDNLLDINPHGDPSIMEDDFVEGTGTAWGVEFLAKKSRGKLTGWLGYTYARLEREVDFNSDGQVLRAAGEIYPPKYDRPHTLNMVISYRLGTKRTIGLTLSMSSGQPYTPVWGKTYTQSGFGSYTNPYENLATLPGRKHSARLPNYFRCDISWTRDIRLFGIEGKFKFQVLNVTNHFNTLLYVWDHSNSPSSVDAVSMFPILPTFGLEFRI